MTTVSSPSSLTSVPLAAERPSHAPVTDAVRDLFERQRARRWAQARTTPRERAAMLLRLGAAIRARRGEIAEAIRADFGKHPIETDLTEIQLTLAELDHAARHVRRWARTQRVGTPVWMGLGRSEIRYEPKGVVLILGAWNFPFALMLAPLVPAIAAGNCVIMRPSEKVPHTNAVVARLIADVFDEDHVAFVEGDVDVAGRLLELPFDHIFFTGSSRIGRRIMAAASRTLASVTLELGGKCPVIVDESADVESAAASICWGKFVSAGQACVAPDYVFVHASRRAALVAALERRLTAFYGASEEERERSADFARVIDAATVERLASLVRSAADQGATVECGGRWNADTRYVAPTILSGVTPAMAVMADEIFGPVLPILEYRSRDEVIDHVRTHDTPLAMYVFGRDRAAVEHFLRSTSSGGTVVNNTLVHLANPDLPFGGAGASGFGSYHGFAGFQAFSHARSVFTQRLSGARAFYPPYGPRVRRLVELMRRLRG
jgi:aldehyde dehydrogenase (NAD+)